LIPTPSLNHPQRWRDRAREIRALVEDLKDEAAKQQVLRIADEYEWIAIRAERWFEVRAEPFDAR
jgi:hypothetical protein